MFGQGLCKDAKRRGFLQTQGKVIDLGYLDHENFVRQSLNSSLRIFTTPSLSFPYSQAALG